MKRLKSILCVGFGLVLLSLGLYSCSQDDVLSQETEQQSSALNYTKIVEKYGMMDVADEASVEKAKNLKAVTPEELDKMLSSVLNTPRTIKISQAPTSTRSRVVVVSGTNQECRAEVHLDIDNVEVVTSDVFYQGLMDIFLVYTHSSASTTKSGSRIDFTVKGEVLVKIIWQGIELKRVSVTMKGYYDVDRGSGELTFF